MASNSRYSQIWLIFAGNKNENFYYIHWKHAVTWPMHFYVTRLQPLIYALNNFGNKDFPRGLDY